MARFRHISTKMVLVLDAGTENGKKIRKRVTVSNIREDAPADALWELSQAMGKLLEYPVAEVRLYKVEAVEREEADGAASENGGVNKEADTDMARAGGEEALPAFVSRGGALSEEKAALAREAYSGVKAASANAAAASRGEHTRLLPPLLKTDAANGRSPPLPSVRRGHSAYRCYANNRTGTGQKIIYRRGGA